MSNPELTLAHTPRKLDGADFMPSIASQRGETVTDPGLDWSTQLANIMIIDDEEFNILTVKSLR